MPIARQTDADLLADFERTTRMPGASPYNSLAVVHKWETLTSDDPHAEVQRKCERITRTLGGLASLVLPVSRLWPLPRNGSMRGSGPRCST